MRKKALKAVWIFEKGNFMARRWVVVDPETQMHEREDSVSAPPLAAISPNMAEDNGQLTKGIEDSPLPL